MKYNNMYSFFKAFRQSILFMFKNRSFAQLGEDLVISNHLEWLGYNIKDKGNYLDIGCYHPHDGSNTHLFYKQGSRGVNVDIGKSKEILFKIFRPGDIFINSAVVPDSMVGNRFKFNLIGYGKKTDNLKIVEDTMTNNFVDVIGISNLLETYTTNFFKTWSIISIDAEGMDGAIVESINFTKYPFSIVVFEMFFDDAKNKMKKSINNSAHDYLEKYGYILQSVCGPTYIYVRKSEIKS